MQRLVIDCQTKQASYVDVPPVEAAALEEESRKESARQLAEEHRALKRALARGLVELREMRGAPAWFDAADVAEKEAAVEEIKGKIKSGI